MRKGGPAKAGGGKGTGTGRVVLGVTVSLDGYAEDSDGRVDALYPDLELLHGTRSLCESIRNTGAVVMAWKEYAMADDPDWYAGNYEYQAPIFVFTDRLPEKHPKETDRLKFTFVMDGVGSAIRKARAAAGAKDVTIIGSARTTTEALMTGLVDVLELDIIPIFLKAGFRPFEGLGDMSLRLERLGTAKLPAGRTHLEFRVRK